MTDSLEAFEAALRDALMNLYNPLFQPSGCLCEALGCGSPEGAAPLQAAIIRAIRRFCPDSDVPPDVPARRYYDLLLYRYVENMTQESAAERMGISSRYLRDLQSQAIQVLARALWTDATTRRDSDAAAQAPVVAPSGATSDQAHTASQIEQELDVLKKNAPDARADVQEAIRSATKFARARSLGVSIAIEEEGAVEDLNALIHPSALRQALLRAIEELGKATAQGAICLSTSSAPGQAILRIASAAPVLGPWFDLALVEQIVASYGGVVQVERASDRTAIVMSLPTEDRAARVRVLVVDDNDDLVAFYRAYTSGTPYEITHLCEGSHLFEQVQQERADVIVLDVMLPDHDMDGWELLVHLHEHPLTRAIPVIVCSVIRDEELALALGAQLYLAKPVRRQQFIQALDRVVNRAS